jgi:hypothetical protein
MAIPKKMRDCCAIASVLKKELATIHYTTAIIKNGIKWSFAYYKFILEDKRILVMLQKLDALAHAH